MVNGFFADPRGVVVVVGVLTCNLLPLVGSRFGEGEVALENGIGLPSGLSRKATGIGRPLEYGGDNFTAELPSPSSS